MGTTASHPDDLLTADQAAVLLGCSYEQVKARLDDGTLPSEAGIRRKRTVRLVRRADIEAYKNERSTRMSAREAVKALGFKSYEGLRGLVVSGELTPVQIAGRPTYDRTEVQRLVAQRAKHLTLQQAADRAGLSRETFLLWFAKTGGTRHLREGGRARYSVQEVDTVREHVVPKGSITATEAATILGLSVVTTRALATSGDLPALVKPNGPKGWRFDPEAVRGYKHAKERTALRSVLDRWSTVVGSGSAAVGTTYGRTVHHADYARDLQDDAKALPSAWQAW
ncbi:helix-turn-helix domain-containing protein [Burkholderia anthina]|uniref:helix-turn-helix domain-containing protein n=1 Tax=Burkholderia anthina TaxID=179879 RepID=UPI0037BEA2CF